MQAAPMSPPETLSSAAQNLVGQGFWESCLQVLQQSVEPTEFQRWLSPLTVQIEGEETAQTLYLGAINSFFVKHIERHFLTQIEQLAAKLSDGRVQSVQLRVVNSADGHEASSTQSELSDSSKLLRSYKSQSVRGGILPESDAINPLYTFDSFVRGKSNTVAYNTCFELAKKNNQSANSALFIHGYSGLGKTHLMHSVANRYQKSGKTVCYFTSDGFMRKVGRAFLDNSIIGFHKKINKADLLIIDDVHLVPSNRKPKMAQVMLSLYSEFVQQGKRVILASDKPPTQMEGFELRFLSRFSEGLTITIDPPEMDTRVQILEKKAEKLAMALPKECAIFIAQNIPPDVRRLEGALNQIHATARVTGEVIDITLVRTVLKPHITPKARAANSERIKTAVAEYYGIALKDLLGKRRLRALVRPRQLAMALTREYTQDSLIDIGAAFGGRDHTTVIHACEQVAVLRETDAEFDKDYQALAATLAFL